MPRPSPDELLLRIQRHERGRLKVFLGYASRVGKSLRMFEEGRRRKCRGQDVVIGAIQAKGSRELDSIIQEFEVIPLLDGDINIDAVLERRPHVCLIDELGSRNSPAARNRQRWQDVEEIRNAGINVVTAVNLQYVGEDSVPEAFLHQADELVIVDTPSGDHPSRERALLLAAEVVEEQLARCMEEHGLSQNWGTQERILVCVTSRSNASAMLDTAARVTGLFHGHLLALHIADAGCDHVDPGVLATLDHARQLGAEVHIVHAPDPICEILRFAREHRVTQIYMGHTLQPAWKFWKRRPVSRLIREAEGMDVRLFPQAAVPA